MQERFGFTFSEVSRATDRTETKLSGEVITWVGTVKWISVHRSSWFIRGKRKLELGMVVSA